MAYKPKNFWFLILILHTNNGFSTSFFKKLLAPQFFLSRTVRIFTISLWTSYSQTLSSRTLCYRNFIRGLLCSRILRFLMHHSRIPNCRSFAVEFSVATLSRVGHFQVRNFLIVFFAATFNLFYQAFSMNW